MLFSRVWNTSHRGINQANPKELPKLTGQIEPQAGVQRLVSVAPPEAAGAGRVAGQERGARGGPAAVTVTATRAPSVRGCRGEPPRHPGRVPPTPAPASALAGRVSPPRLRPPGPPSEAGVAVGLSRR